ncbi:NAD(P)/FAD-dependent oxidoreductase [Helicobacter sp. 13S00477-4]|uniref:NAD(P)/FAD-dependent oxidoreductase n=1 Tax=Helicobacter sp. 13S00477-4 TaxID=1905759 RepID=UPI000BA5316A|nr:NAD(P)/FAD-dependent oxidoreductase [Helicobacter sp. 13S00477-4]PAF52773.1 NADH dehydrogenase [Helicobacter sp. 13S00477-4]
MKKPKILLLGAGYGCLSFLKELKKDIFKAAQFTLINNNTYHYHTIVLHEVGAGAKNKSTQYDLKNILPKEVELIIDEVTEIKQNCVITKNKSFDYDYLIIGLGFQSDSFGIKGIEQYSLSITSFLSAQNISNHIQNKLKFYLENKDNNELKFIVCGGGFTGIEFSASLAQELHKEAKKLNIDTSLIEISCIEAMPHILPMFDENMSKMAVQRLQNLGIKVWENSKILECQKDGVIIQNEDKEKKITAHTIIWSAGVKGNSVIENSNYFESKRSKIEIDAFLHPIQELPNKNKIFILGDCGALQDPNTKRFFPPTAQLATQEGKYLAKNINVSLLGNQPKNPFVFKSGDSICSLGKGYGLGTVNGRNISGFKAYILKRIIENLWNIKISGLSSIFKKD